MWKLSLLCLCTWSIVLAQDETLFTAKEGVKASSASLIFNDERVVVNPGQRLQLDCGVEGDYRYCFWENKDGENHQTLQLEDVMGGFLKGFSPPTERKGNECGIVINSVNAKDHHGDWTCNVFVVANALQGTKRVIVTVKPQFPSLDINENPLVVAEGQEKEVSCTVSAARPPAIIRWFVGTEDVSAKSDSENIPTDDKGTYRSVSTLKYKFHYTEDRKSLRCSIEHTTLQEPEIAEVPLDVRFAPYPISTTRIYGIPLESEYEIKYNFTSNPVPKMSWHINDDLQIPVPGESGRYLTSIRNLMDNIYMATLRIRDFNSNDVNMNYRLHAVNELGEKNFDITLSTGPAPPDTIGNGTIAAIIVIVVFIIILLFIIGMMRYRQMYCFGPKDRIKNHLKESGENLKEEHSDTESAREPKNSKGKASNLLRSFTSMIKPKKMQKEPRLDKIEEGEAKEERGSRDDLEGKSNNPSEIVYAELELSKNAEEKANEKAKNSNTEYAEIVGTVPDNKSRERKE